MTGFRGLYPPLITTFDQDGEFDEGRMREHVDFMIEGGADGLCAGSSTGEFMNLSRQEWESVLGGGEGAVGQQRTGVGRGRLDVDASHDRALPLCGATGI